MKNQESQVVESGQGSAPPSVVLGEGSGSGSETAVDALLTPPNVEEEGIRLRIKSPQLYQLSYGPNTAESLGVSAGSAETLNGGAPPGSGSGSETAPSSHAAGPSATQGAAPVATPAAPVAGSTPVIPAILESSPLPLPQLGDRRCWASLYRPGQKPEGHCLQPSGHPGAHRFVTVEAAREQQRLDANGGAPPGSGSGSGSGVLALPGACHKQCRDFECNDLERHGCHDSGCFAEYGPCCDSCPAEQGAAPVATPAVSVAGSTPAVPAPCGSLQFPHIYGQRENDTFRSCRWCGARETSSVEWVAGLGRCIFQPSCESSRAAGSQFCHDHDPHRSPQARRDEFGALISPQVAQRELDAIPNEVGDDKTQPVAHAADSQLLADHYAVRADVRARLFMLPSGRWHADICGPGGKFTAISTPDMEKAVYFLARRLRGAL